MRQRCLGKRHAKRRNRRHSYTKVLDNRKHPIRGLWRRNGKYLARITVEDDQGRKAIKWSPLKASTVAEAQEELRTLLVERSQNQLRHIGKSPKLTEYLNQKYLPLLATSGKKPGTLVTEKGHLERWREALGHLDLDKIRAHHLTGHLQQLKERGRSNRTCNLALVCLRSVLKAARIDGYIKALPSEGIPWRRTERRARPLFTREEIDQVCAASLLATKNGQEFADYIRLMALCGSREQETLKIRWSDVDFEGKLLTIGAEGDTKNRECRRVDMNPDLETHLRRMDQLNQRCSPASQWLFPSPQRGERDVPCRTFRESLLLTRAASGWVCGGCGKLLGREPVEACPECGAGKIESKERVLSEKLQRFGFHDCRHHFTSLRLAGRSSPVQAPGERGSR